MGGGELLIWIFIIGGSLGLVALIVWMHKQNIEDEKRLRKRIAEKLQKSDKDTVDTILKDPTNIFVDDIADIILGLLSPNTNKQKQRQSRKISKSELDAETEIVYGAIKSERRKQSKTMLIYIVLMTVLTVVLSLIISF